MHTKQIFKKDLPMLTSFHSVNTALFPVKHIILPVLCNEIFHRIQTHGFFSPLEQHYFVVLDQNTYLQFLEFSDCLWNLGLKG